MRKHLVAYVLVLVTFGFGTTFILRLGARLPPGQPPPAAGGGSVAAAAGHPQSILLLQILVILVAARVVGVLFRRLGQPAVIGEMLAGILLGPSFLGMLFPGSQAFLFPMSSMGVLQALSQIGVVLFMFVVGTEMDLDRLRQQAHTTVLVSHASIMAPFFLGAVLSLVIYSTLAPPRIPFVPFALFVSTAMSITAFPVLARILRERGLAGTPLGDTVIACAAVDDVTAWCLLAVVVAVVRADGLAGVLLTILLALVFAGLMLLFVRPRLAGRFGDAPGGVAHPRAVVAGALAFAFASALFSEVIGIHSFFGAFLAGTVVSSHPRLRGLLKERIETVTSLLLLPLFFAFAGLRTEIGLLGDARSWLACAGIIAVAIAGKLGAGALAARWTGLPWREALMIGTLMNTRGLMELVVLNVGFDLGILSARMFTMMVLMALVTTCMCGPLLALLERVPVGDAERRSATLGGRA